MTVPSTAPPPAPALIVAEGLHNAFGPVDVLRGIDLAVTEGEVVCLIGPSGSGKTTLPRCFAMLEAPIRVKGMQRDAAVALAEALLAKVGLSERRDVHPTRLSGGQQQRAAIARALAMAPKVMLFDEVTSALDPELKRDVLLVMLDLAADGMTMIVITHEMTFALRVSHRIVFMDHGQIVEEAPPSAFFGSPCTERARRFLQQVEE